VQVFVDEISAQVNADGLLRKLAGQEANQVAIPAADIEDPADLIKRVRDLSAYLFRLYRHTQSPVGQGAQTSRPSFCLAS
jgi:hypothetical protein